MFMFIINTCGILVIWILLYILVRVAILKSIGTIQRRDIKKYGRELLDYEHDKRIAMIYVNSTFVVAPILIILRFLDRVFEKKRIVPFSTNSWIIGSVIVGIVWIIFFTFFFIKGINQIKLQEKKDKKRKSKEEYYDEKRWNFGLYTIAIGIGIPLIILMWYGFF